MGVSNKDLKLLPGWRKPLKGGDNHFVILTSQYFSDYTDISIPRVYLGMTEGGLGIIEEETNPSLQSVIFGLESEYNVSNLIASYQITDSGSYNLSGTINGYATGDFTGYYIPSYSGYSTIFSYYSTTNSGFSDLQTSIVSLISSSGELNSSISGIDFRDLNGFYRVSFSGQKDLDANIYAIPPMDLNADLLGLTYTTLSSTITAIEATTLTGSISGVPYLDLSAEIYGYDYYGINSSYSGYNYDILQASISGIAEGEEEIQASIDVVKGIEIEKILDSSISGYVNASGDLYGYYVGHTPLSLDASLYGVGPQDIEASINPVPSGVSLLANISGILPEGSIEATIIGTGGTKNLISMYRPSTSDDEIINSFIDGVGSSSLIAAINAGTQELLNAIINPSGAPIGTNLTAKIIPNRVEELQGSYVSISGNLLKANIEPIPYEGLQATITPRVFYIDSTIPINTYAIRNLKAIINSDNCLDTSSYRDLGVIITGKVKEDLSAKIISIAGQYATTNDQLEIFIKNSVISEDWIPFILHQPAVIEDEFPITLTTAPFEDLQAQITGVHSHEDISASITPLYYSHVLRDHTSTVQWINTNTGERRVVKIFFRGDVKNFYYSDLANDTFSFTPDDYLEIEVESYEPIEDEEGTLLSTKTDVKTCTVDKLKDFPTIDEAIKFAITCAVSEIHEDLRAVIVAKGSKKELEAEITPIESDRVKQLDAKIFPSVNLPELNASISSTGDFEDINSYIKGVNQSQTNSSFFDVSGYRYKPKVVTHGTNKVSIVLTRVYSTDILPSDTPDLSVSIRGIDEKFMSATITGSV